MSKTNTVRERILRRIAKLRSIHTQNFEAQRWQENDTINRKIREAWASYHHAQ